MKTINLITNDFYIQKTEEVISWSCQHSVRCGTLIHEYHERLNMHGMVLEHLADMECSDTIEKQ